MRRPYTIVVGYIVETGHAPSLHRFSKKLLTKRQSYQQNYTKIDFFALYRIETYKNTKKLWKIKQI